MADAPFSQNIKQLTHDSYQNSAAHGFWNEPDTVATIPMKLALIHSEASEALESYRDPASDDLVKVPSEVLDDLIMAARAVGPEIADVGQAILDKWKAKPKGFDIELADILIRVFDLAGAKGIDLDAALRVKMNYNKGRAPMHGRKV